MAERSSTARFAVEQSRRLLAQLSVQIARAAKSSSAEAVHHLRVTIRRFTQSVAVCKPCFPKKDARKGRRLLKKIMTAAGEARNCDIALKYLRKWRQADEEHLHSEIETRRKESADDLATQLKEWTDRQMLAKWRATLAAGGKEKALPDDIPQRAISRIAEDFLELGTKAASSHASPHALHRFRIVAKKFRYTLELFQPHLGSSATAVIGRIKRAGGLLGDINDCVTVADMITELSGGKRLLSHLKKRQHKKTEEFRKYWQTEFADGKELGKWIHPRKPVASAMHRGSRPASRGQAASAI
jgi:CHAD domain-containing protein